MIAHGELEPVEGAIFADTGWEPVRVYEWLNWLESEIQRCPHPFPIYRVSQGNLREDQIKATNTTGQRFAAVLLLKPTSVSCRILLVPTTNSTTVIF